MRMIVESIEGGMVNLKKFTEEGITYQQVRKELFSSDVKIGDVVVNEDGKFVVERSQTNGRGIKMRPRFRRVMK